MAGKIGKFSKQGFEKLLKYSLLSQGNKKSQNNPNQVKIGLSAYYYKLILG